MTAKASGSHFAAKKRGRKPVETQRIFITTDEGKTQAEVKEGIMA